MIDLSRAVFVLKLHKWEESIGVKDEIDYATRQAIPLYDITVSHESDTQMGFNIPVIPELMTLRPFRPADTVPAVMTIETLTPAWGFPSRRLPNWLQAYLDYTEDTEAPREMHFWTGVSVLAAALRRRVWFDMGYFRWYPNFFIVFVAPPGIVKKTSTIDIGVDLIRNVKDVIFTPDSVTWQKLLKFLEDNQQVVTITNPDGSVTKKQMAAVSAYIGELENFLKLHDEGFNGTLIALYDGKVEDTQYVHSTVGGVSAGITNPWLNLIGATTPSWIRQSIPENMIGGGLFSRIVFVCADKRNRVIAYPKYETRRDRSKLETTSSTISSSYLPTTERWSLLWKLSSSAPNGIATWKRPALSLSRAPATTATTLASKPTSTSSP